MLPCSCSSPSRRPRGPATRGPRQHKPRIENRVFPDRVFAVVDDGDEVRATAPSPRSRRPTSWAGAGVDRVIPGPLHPRDDAGRLRGGGTRPARPSTRSGRLSAGRAAPTSPLLAALRAAEGGRGLRGEISSQRPPRGTPGGAHPGSWWSRRAPRPAPSRPAPAPPDPPPAPPATEAGACPRLRLGPTRRRAVCATGPRSRPPWFAHRRFALLALLAAGGATG